MAIDLGRVPGRLKEAARSGTLIPFVGAGLSRSAKTTVPKAFPTWLSLLEDLQEIAEQGRFIGSQERQQIAELVKAGKLLMAAQALRSLVPHDVIDGVLNERFNPEDAEPGQIHRSLFKLKSPFIITTNFDCLLEDAYAREYGRFIQQYTYRDAVSVQAVLQRHRRGIDRPVIFKIHGSCASAFDVILSELDYRNIMYREPGYRTVLSAIFVTRVILMLGFSFEDPEIRFLLESIRDSLQYRNAPDYIVLPRGQRNSIEKRRWRDDFGIETIEYDPEAADHHELVEFVDYLASYASGSSDPLGAEAT